MKIKHLIIANLIISLLFLFLGKCLAQEKHHWKQTGWSTWRKDTIEHTYTLIGKDSISYKITIENCNCDFYIEIGTHKKHSCKGLQRHFMETEYWDWNKSLTWAKGKLISRVKPHWENNMGSYSTIDGTFIVGNKQVYPCRLVSKKETLIINNY